MLREELYEAICQTPVIDVHSHVDRARLSPPDAGTLMFYHMLMYCLRAAGVPDEKMWSDGGMHGQGRPMDEWFEAWPAIENTGFAWWLKSILRDLYGFDEPLTRESYPRLEAVFAAKAAGAEWPREVLAKGNVRRVLSSTFYGPALQPGQFDGHVRFTFERAPTGGTSEFWPWRDRLAGWARRFGREISSSARLDEATAAFYEQGDWSDKHALVSWISSMADFRPVDTVTVDRLLADALAGKPVEAEASRLLDAAITRATCRAIRGKTRVFQICYGVQFLTREPKSVHPVQRAAPEFAGTLGYLLGEFPDLHFNLLNGYEPDEPLLCALAQGYKNVSLGCFWWQTFYPSVMHQALLRRLDMVPASRLMGYFSDGYSVDHVYGRLALVRRVLAKVLAEKVEDGQYTKPQAVRIAREILFETPRRIFLPDEKIEA